MTKSDRPERFDLYSVKEYLGGGSYGHVFRVQDDKCTEYALKWLGAGLGKDGPRRFENEKWALLQLKHVAIPELVATGIFDGRPYIVMTLARGTSLRRRLNDQLRNHEQMGEMRLLPIVKAVLDALAHMHSLEIYHRDVKDDNVVATESVSHVSLIDFGFCAGPKRPVDVEADSFWRVGAARYSPPSKLHHPVRAYPSHDVFAVGVLGYLLLTNHYPWDFSQDEDVGDLAERMQKDKPISIRKFNNLVSKDVADLLENMLVIDDDLRITAYEAMQRSGDILDNLSRGLAAPAIAHGTSILYPRVVRDPLHGDVRLTNYEWSLINSPEFQRLRWNKQLGLADLIFPGATHSRLSHSIGTLHVAERILRSIEDITGEPFVPDERLMVRCFALVHDICHVAFGHTLEDELNLFDAHDQNRGRVTRLVLDDKSRLGTLLRSTEYGRVVLAHLDPSSTVVRHIHIAELVTGPTGADVIDYVDRDSMFCGLDHRVDSALYRRFRLVQMKAMISGERHLATSTFGRHGLRLDAEFALESVLLERYALFLKVYTHPAKAAAGAMLGKAIEELRANRRAEHLSERDLEWYGDHELLTKLRSSSCRIVRDIADRLFERRLFKPVYRSRVLPKGERDLSHYDTRRRQFKEKQFIYPDGRRAAEAALAKKAGLKPGSVAIYCIPNAPGLQSVRRYVEEQPGKTVVLDEVHSAHFHIVERHLALWTVYVFCGADATEPKNSILAEASEDLFGFKNEIETERRQLVLF